MTNDALFNTGNVQRTIAQAKVARARCLTELAANARPAVHAGWVVVLTAALASVMGHIAKVS